MNEHACIVIHLLTLILPSASQLLPPLLLIKVTTNGRATENLFICPLEIS